MLVLTDAKPKIILWLVNKKKKVKNESNVFRRPRQTNNNKKKTHTHVYIYIDLTIMDDLTIVFDSFPSHCGY